LSKGDKILSENYFQHADHFLRILNDKEKNQNNSNQEKNNLQNNEFENEVISTDKVVSSN